MAHCGREGRAQAPATNCILPQEEHSTRLLGSQNTPHLWTCVCYHTCRHDLCRVQLEASAALGHATKDQLIVQHSAMQPGTWHHSNPSISWHARLGCRVVPQLNSLIMRLVLLKLQELEGKTMNMQRHKQLPQSSSGACIDTSFFFSKHIILLTHESAPVLGPNPIVWLRSGRPAEHCRIKGDVQSSTECSQRGLWLADEVIRVNEDHLLPGSVEAWERRSTSQPVQRWGGRDLHDQSVLHSPIQAAPLISIHKQPCQANAFESKCRGFQVLIYLT